MYGRFINFEGGEGAGKSTQIQLLAEYLKSEGKDVLITREPGGSEGAETVRTLLVTGDVNRWDGVTEAMLVFAGRRDHYERVIKPALKSGTYVLCDRFADSSYAYQGAGQGVETAILDQLYQLACGDFRPDLTLILDMPVAVGIERAVSRGGDEHRFEDMETDFHERVRNGFLTIAKHHPDRCVVIDAEQPIKSIATEIQCTVMARFL